MQRLRNTTAICAAIITFATAAWAQGQKAIDVPAQPLAQAIDELSAETGTPILVQRDLVAGLQSTALTGPMSPRRALEAMIAGTGLSVRELADASLVISSNGQPTIPSQGQTDSPLVADEILVQGERTQRSVFETPSSVVVVTQETLDHVPGTATVDEVVERTPNFTNAGTPDELPVIRGVTASGISRGLGAISGGLRPRANLAIDGRNASPREAGFNGFSTYDTRQIELFRGPQTIAQGTNAIAGAIQIYTNDPEFEFGAGARAKIGNREAYNLAGFITGPIVEEEIAFRLTADLGMEESVVDFGSAFPGQTDIDRQNLRAKLLIEPTAIPELSAKVTINHAQNQSPSNTAVVEPFDQLVARDFNTLNREESESLSGIVDVTYQLSPYWEFSNQLAYSEFEITGLSNFSPRNDQTLFLFEGTELANETILRFDDPAGQFSGFAGVYYAVTETDERGAVVSPVFDQILDKKTSLGLFASVTYAPIEDLELTGSVRYQRETQDREGRFIFTNVDFDKTFDAFLPRAEIAYDVNDDLRVGAFLARGFNQGGFTVDFNTGGSDFYDQETVWNYEIYARGSFLDNRLNVSANAFFADWNGFQKSSIIGFDPFGNPVVQNDNIDAITYGFEMQADFQATDELLFFGSVGLLKTSFDELVAPGVTAEREFSRSPTYTATIGVDYSPIPDLTLSAQARFSDGYFSDDDNNPANRIDAYSLVDLAAHYEIDDRITAFAYVENVFDTVEATFIFQQAPFGSVASSVTTPRTFGAGLEVNF